MTNSGEGYKAEEIKVIAGVGWSFSPTPQQPAGADWWTPKQSVICDGVPVRFTQAVCTVIHALTQTDGHTHTHKHTKRVACFQALRQQDQFEFAIRDVRRWEVEERLWKPLEHFLLFHEAAPCGRGHDQSAASIWPPVPTNFMSSFTTSTNIVFALPSSLHPSTNVQPMSVWPLWLYLQTMIPSSSDVLIPDPIHPAYSQGELHKTLKMTSSFTERAVKLVRANRLKLKPERHQRRQQGRRQHLSSVMRTQTSSSKEKQWDSWHQMTCLLQEDINTDMV